MIFFRGGIRRVLLGILALVSLLAFFYEAFYLSSGYKMTIRASSLSSPNYSLSFKLPSSPHDTAGSGVTPKVLQQPHSTTLGSEVIKKLDDVYQQINMSRSNFSKSLFPAKQIGKYLLNNPNICTDAKIIDVIIIVHTAPTNFKARLGIRQTFAKREFFFPKQVRIAFLLGKPKDTALEKVLEEEHHLYNDTVMGDFYDDYHNLTLKGVMGFHWVGEHCSNARVVLKIDDDVVVDMYSLLNRYLNYMEGKQKSIFCNTWQKNMGIMRVGKWKVPDHIFRGLRNFPYFYCSGFTVLLSTDLMLPLYNAAKITPFFWIDDLFLFGILPKMVGGVTYHDYKLGQNLTFYARDMYNCLQKRGEDCEVLSTLVHRNHIHKTWSNIQSLRNKTINKKWYVKTFYET